jgi:DUF3014 family protein
MEPGSTHDDSPYPRYRESSTAAWWALAIAVVLGGIATAYYYLRPTPAPGPIPSAAPAPRPEAAAPSGTAPAIGNPLAVPAADPAKPLPTLDNSDAMMRDALVGLMGRQPFDALIYPAQLIRRIVATVDNLPRPTAPRRVMPFEQVPGKFSALHAGASLAIAPDNAGRYQPYVRVIEAIDARALVQRYVASYPLFQKAYEELGYPGRYFNDRLVEAIDNLLAAPELDTAPALLQPKVFYEFADPDLETRSAGQKIMMRMGAENAAKVKAKLRAIRDELRGAARR